ncbi:MAG TPA: glycosyltransferase family 2 protein [Flavisolibacter sp.]|nr:glycosyltransferase family 2 protein [Flavisolibacter sp.]
MKSCSLLISTYNWPSALELCLMSVQAQAVLPAEVVIADDGSRADTGQLIERMQQSFPVPIKHVWHPDEGFRLSAIRNRGILACTESYIVQTDGDLILHPHYIADHLQFQKKGFFVTGSRVMLSKASTENLIANTSIDLKKWGADQSNFFNGVRNRFVRELLAERYKMKGKYRFYVKGCNMAFWRADLLAVNGYNEAFTGWGREDSELAIRLMNAGIKKQFIKMGAVCYHLHHTVASRDLEPRNVALMEQAIEKKIILAPEGLNKYAG